MTNRRPTDRQLRRWLKSGRPRRIGDLVGEPEIDQRLEALTELQDAHRLAISELTAPIEQFEERIIAGVQTRKDNQGTASLLADLLGLGFHVGRALSSPASPRSDKSSSGGPDGEAGET